MSDRHLYLLFNFVTYFPVSSHNQISFLYTKFWAITSVVLFSDQNINDSPLNNWHIFFSRGVTSNVSTRKFIKGLLFGFRFFAWFVDLKYRLKKNRDLDLKQKHIFFMFFKNLRFLADFVHLKVMEVNEVFKELTLTIFKFA
jgi:hypothetical protein